MKGKLAIPCVLGAVLGAGLWLWPPSPVPRHSGPLLQEVYVWQRTWNPSLVQAVVQQAEAFSSLITLSAEVTWKNGRPQVAQARPDYDALARLKQPVGIALRIGPCPGPLADQDERVRWLAGLATNLVHQAQSHGLEPAELQIDFDCPASQLAGYREWVERIQGSVAPVPVVITALPSWLKRPAMKELAEAADGLVLQVHSLDRPRNFESRHTLCDPEAARRAVERAAHLRKPFRVALPTYSYLTAFAPDGRFLGLTAEGPSLAWPAGTRIREVRSDPKELAALVAGWTRDRPECLRGLIWYRLPVEGDRWNWSWLTLDTVMKGRAPRAGIQAQAQHTDGGLVEFDLINHGDEDHFGPFQLAVHWKEARRVAADALLDFELMETDRCGLRFTSLPGSGRLRAGTRRTIGWIRLDQESEVTFELE